MKNKILANNWLLDDQPTLLVDQVIGFINLYFQGKLSFDDLLMNFNGLEEINYCSKLTISDDHYYWYEFFTSLFVLEDFFEGKSSYLIQEVRSETEAQKRFDQYYDSKDKDQTDYFPFWRK